MALAPLLAGAVKLTVAEAENRFSANLSVDGWIS
jgi:hypothetical protein